MKKSAYWVIAIIVFIVIFAYLMVLQDLSQPFKVTFRKFDYGYEVIIHKQTSETLRNVDIWTNSGNKMVLMRHYDYWMHESCIGHAYPIEGQSPQVTIYWEGGHWSCSG